MPTETPTKLKPNSVAEGMRPDELIRIAGIADLPSLAMIGLSKNAGKTTCLNHILRAWQGSGQNRPLALTSIGRDGEEEDVVSGQAKPRIYIHRGTLVATATESLRRADALLEIRDLSGIRTAFGEVAICRAQSDGFVELAGPASAGELMLCEKILRKEEPNCFFIVDGALSRRAPAGGGFTQNAILAIGACLAPDAEKVARATTHALALLNLPQPSDEMIRALQDGIHRNPNAKVFIVAPEGQAKALNLNTIMGNAPAISEAIKEESTALFLRGAVTDLLLRELFKTPAFSKMSFVVEDGTRLFISPEILQGLTQREVRLLALAPLHVKMLCVNPMRVDGSLSDVELMLEQLLAITTLPVLNLGPYIF